MTTITSQDAMRLIAKMRELYGRKFDQQWDGVDVESLANTVAECLDGLTIEEMRAGIARMMREPWPPTIPEFRQWCEQGGTWLTADEAWAMALGYLSDSKNEITMQAKQALQQVRYIIDGESQRAAARAFRDVYARNVEHDKSAGLSQSYAPKSLPKPELILEPISEQQRAKNLTAIERIKQQIGGAA